MNPFEGLLDDFLLEAGERARRVEELLLSAADATPEARISALTEAKRELHTLKGNSGMMGLNELQKLAHQMEDLVADLDPEAPVLGECFAALDRFKSLLKNRGEIVSADDAAERGEKTARGSKAETTKGDCDAEVQSIRVSFADLDDLVDLLAEMVIFRNRLGDAVFRGLDKQSGNPQWEEVQSAREALGKTLGFIQDRVMRLRMVPLGSLFSQLKRIVYDESRRDDKRVHLEITGGETPLDKALLEVCSRALGHIVRNAVVHGIESSEARVAAGKPPEGLISLKAEVRSAEVVVTVSDDGRGVDPEQLQNAAVQRGEELVQGQDPLTLLFRSGFSTKNGADIASGRGMGLSAAAEAVHGAGGRIEVKSTHGAGCLFRLHLPLSVSITRAMLVRADGEEYALPLASVVESVRFEPGDGHQLNWAGVMRWRGSAIPFLDLGVVCGTAGAIRERGFAVVLYAEGKHRGLVVDELTGMKEIVVKGLDATVGNPAGVSGSTILGDGRVLLILDPKGLVEMAPFMGQEPPFVTKQPVEEMP